MGDFRAVPGHISISAEVSNDKPSAMRLFVYPASPVYLNEYVYRFNRRFYPMTAFNSILALAAHSVPPTYETLYSGEWNHPI